MNVLADCWSITGCDDRIELSPGAVLAERDPPTKYRLLSSEDFGLSIISIYNSLNKAESSIKLGTWMK